jgi:hypothetical protein
MDTVIVPQDLPRVIYRATQKDEDFARLVSARRLLFESVAMSYILRAPFVYAEESAATWGNEEFMVDSPFVGWTVRIPDDDDVVGAWTNEADLCYRLADIADDVLVSGALGISG